MLSFKLIIIALLLLFGFWPVWSRWLAGAVKGYWSSLKETSGRKWLCMANPCKRPARSDSLFCDVHYTPEVTRGND